MSLYYCHFFNTQIYRPTFSSASLSSECLFIAVFSQPANKSQIPALIFLKLINHTLLTNNGKICFFNIFRFNHQFTFLLLNRKVIDPNYFQTPWSCGLIRHVLNWKVEGSNLAAAKNPIQINKKYLCRS